MLTLKACSGMDFFPYILNWRILLLKEAITEILQLIHLEVKKNH